MGWLIFSVIVVILGFVGLGICGDGTWKINFKQVLALFGLLIMIPAFFYNVPSNSVGILYSPFSGVSEKTLSNGWTSKNPFSKIYVISTETQTSVIEDVVTQTYDSQFVTTTLDVKYEVDPSNAFLVFKQYKTLDNFKTSTIKSTVQKALELVTTKYDVISILGNKRADVYAELEKELNEELKTYGITYKKVIINDMDAGAKIESAIEAQAVAEKSVETAKAELEKSRTESQKKSVEAQANQDAAKIKAETKLIEARAEAEANELLTKSLTKEVLQQMTIDKWNGELSKVVSGEGGFIIDIGDISKSK